MTQPVMASQLKAGPRPWVATAVLVLLAAALGVFSDVGQRLPGGWAQVPELGTPWVLCGFAAARVWAPRRGTGLLVAIAVLLAGLGSYFLFMHLWHGVAYYNLLKDGRGSYWFTMAAGLGAVAAAAGTLSRSSAWTLQALGWGFVPAVALAETLFVASRGGPDPTLLLLLLLAAGVALGAWAWWQCPTRPGLLLAAAGWSAAGLGAVPVAIRLM